MKNLTTTQNADLAFKNFALSYSNDGDVKAAVECAKDFLDNVVDVDVFEKLLALFLAGKYSIVVEKMNDDGTWRNENIIFKGSTEYRKEKRKEFEKAKWVTLRDCMPANPSAEKECKSCGGFGVVDMNAFAGCLLENCPDCWK